MRRRSKSENCSLELWYFYFFIFWRSVCPFLSPLKIYDLGIPRPEASSITFVIHLRVENMCLQKFWALLHNTWPLLMWNSFYRAKYLFSKEHIHFMIQRKII